MLHFLFGRKAGTARANITTFLISLLIVSMTLAFYNIRVSQRLGNLGKYGRISLPSSNVSSGEMQRILETYGQELGRVMLPDEAQDRIDEATRYNVAIPEGLLPTIDWTRQLPNKNIDIGVPVSGQDTKLFEFFRTLGKSIAEFYRLSRADITVRVIVTRYPQDDASNSFRERLAQEASLKNDQVLFATTNQSKFQRALAINLLHNTTKRNRDSVLAIVDVDMDIGPRFLYTSLGVVTKGRFYFPIVFSLYRPSNVLLVEEFLGPQQKYSKHRGMWRDFGFGMYAISGSDVTRYQLDESFKGWGGEDTEFYHRIRYHRGATVVRRKEYDLVHRWHAKYCKLDGFVEADKLQTCVMSRNVMEGSNFCQLMLRLNASESSIIQALFASSRILSNLVAQVVDSKLYGIYAKSQRRHFANLEVIRALESKHYNKNIEEKLLDNKISRMTIGEAKATRIGGVLIGVTTSRATFPTRVAEALQTWAKRLPQDFHVRFFVGDLTEQNISYTAGSDEDIANLAMQAGISDTTKIVVMKGIQDDEYPLVEKAAAVLHHINKAAIELERQFENKTINWFFDVDDDTYVNIGALEAFLAKRDFEQHNYIGRRGMGAMKDREMLRKGGLKQPYCMGGTGILIGRTTFRVLAENIHGCIADAKETQTVVYDDVVFGMCLQRRANVGCWDDPSYREDTFVHNFHGSGNVPRNSELHRTITLHPHKIPGLMTKTHERFTRFVYNVTS